MNEVGLNPFEGQRKRFVIVHYSKHFEAYTLTFTNQGRFHYDTAKAAIRAAKLFAPQLKAKLGIEDIKVLHTECWPSGDCCSTVFDDKLVEACEVKEESCSKSEQIH